MTKTQHGIVACVIGATTWGFNGVVSQFLLSHYPVEPSWLASIRMCLAGLFLTLMVLPTKRAEIRQMLHDPVSLRHLVLFALFGLILSQFSYLSAIKNSNADRAGNPVGLPGLWRRLPGCDQRHPVDDGHFSVRPDLGPHRRHRLCHPILSCPRGWQLIGERPLPTAWA